MGGPGAVHTREPHTDVSSGLERSRDPIAVPLSYCLDEALWALRCPAWGQDPPPWAPGRREEVAELDRMDASEPSWCLSEVDIFRDLSPAEMEAIGEAAPRRTHGAGEILYSPLEPVETLFILKAGRVRIFRVAPDGRALTTALITPGTIFGEMVLLGQRMHDNFAEAIEEAVVCVMNRDDVQRLLLSDPRIAARIAEILGARLAEMERRLSDTVFKNVHQRIARSLATLLSERRPGILSRPPQVLLTHEQIAALVGTTRETATKVLGDLADEGLIRLSRGRITVIDPKAVAARAEE